jgi:hypothetical protein
MPSVRISCNGMRRIATVAVLAILALGAIHQVLSSQDYYSSLFTMVDERRPSSSNDTEAINSTVTIAPTTNAEVNINSTTTTYFTLSTNSTSVVEQPTRSFFFPKGIWSDEGMEFAVTSEQEHLFEPFVKSKYNNTTTSINGGAVKTCPWKRNETDVSQECLDLLRPVTQNVRLWYFLGDSTMARPWQWCLVQKLENRSTTLKRAKDWGIKGYLGVSKQETLRTIKPINVSMGEGPTDPSHFYLSGCTTCENRLIQFRQAPARNNATEDTSLSSVSYAEFLGVEYARDVEFATTEMATTQETIARHMDRRRNIDLDIPRNQTACLISSGLHDLSLANLTSDVYIRNHIAMKKLFKEAGCDIWIKLELTAIGYRVPNAPSNKIIYEWNEGIKRSMEADEYQIDLFGRSLNSAHGDNIHMDRETFYCPLADFFIKLMGVAEEER